MEKKWDIGSASRIFYVRYILICHNSFVAGPIANSLAQGLEELLVKVYPSLSFQQLNLTDKISLYLWSKIFHLRLFVYDKF